MRGSVDERTTSPHAAATATDVRVAARVLQPGDDQPAAKQRRSSAQVLAGGGLLAVLLVALAVSVIWVANDAKHPLVQPNPSPPTSAAPATGPTVATAPAPLPITTTQPPRPADAPLAPVETLPPSPGTAERIQPTSPPEPRHRRRHEFFPHLFPSG